MKAKTFLLCCGIFIAFAIFWSAASDSLTEAGMNPVDYARITDVEYKAVVQDEPDGEASVLITERLTFDVHAASKNNLFWELWRDLPEDDVDGAHVYYTVRSVRQLLDDGSEVVYEESPRLYWEDYDYVSTNPVYGPGKWYHSEGPYDESDAQYECVFFYVDGLYREKVIFEVEYEMHNAALRYNDCSDLYLSLYSGSSVRHLNSFSAQILFPDENMPEAGNYLTFTYGTDAESFPVEESADANPGYYTFSFALDKEALRFHSYNEFIEFDLVAFGEDRHCFTEYAPSNLYSSDDVLEEILEEQQSYAAAPARFRTAKCVLFALCLLLGLSAPLYVLFREHRIRARYSFFSPARDYPYYEEIPSDLDPHFAAELVFSRDRKRREDSGGYAALLLSLAQKKYVSLREEQFYPAYQAEPDLVISLTPAEHIAPMTLCEQYYFDLLRRHASRRESVSTDVPEDPASAGADSQRCISMSTLRHRISSDYESSRAFAENIRNSTVNIGVGDGYFQKAAYTEPRRKLHVCAVRLRVAAILLLFPVNLIFCRTRLGLAFGGFTLLGILLLLSALLLDSRARKYLLLTQKGEDEYAKWRGLYRFLQNDTLLRQRGVADLSLWERYLVYATAFGLSDKVIESISILCPADVSVSRLSSSCYHPRRFRHHSRSFRSAVRSGAHGSYNGGGGGFGYGGGGRGGGGGGGGH